MKMGSNARGISAAIGTLVLGLAAFAAPEARAQVPYEIALDTAVYNPISTGTTFLPEVYSFGYDRWDEGAAELPLPFVFRWFGRGYRSVWVYTNGLLSFDAPPTGPVNILRAPPVVPSPGNVPHNFIAPLWQNLEASPAVGTPPEIRLLIQGTTPNRVAIIQVSGLRKSGAPSSLVEFQVRLEERTSSVQIIYSPNGFGVTGATVAIEDAFGVLGANLLLSSTPGCGVGCACPAQGCTSSDVGTAGSITIRPPATAELIGAIEGPAGAYPGDVFTASVAVSNVGLAAAGAFQAELRLSADANIDSNDTLLRTLPYPGLAAGVTSSQTVSLTMPAGLPVARYYLGLIVDSTGVITESVEVNNAARDPGGIVTGPDLQGTVAAQLNSGPGEMLPIQLGIRSNGAPVRGQVRVRLLLSEDNAVSGDDLILSDASYVLPDGFSLDTVVTVVVPPGASAHSYRVLAFFDPLNITSEIDETNNVAVSPGQVTLSLADLEAFDLRSEAVAFRGLPFPVTAVLNNRGGGTARSFTSCLVISRNPLISTVSDPVLVRTGPMTLEAGGSATLRFEPTIDVSTSTGTWELAVVADCDEAVTENLETNNVKRRMPAITVRDPSADFVPLAVVTASTGAAGEGLAVSALIGNYGTARGAAKVRLVLSDSPGASVSDPQIYETPLAITLEPGEEQSFSVFAVLPSDLLSGTYVVGVVVDPDDQLDEVDEGNNILPSRSFPAIGSSLAIVSPPPPNAVLTVPYVWRFRAIGSDAAVVWTLTWKDGRAPGGLSFDAAKGELSGTATVQNSYEMTVTAAAAGMSATQRYPFLVTPPNLPLELVSTKLPAALQHERYSVRLVAVGGTPPYRWTVSGGRLPSGLGLSESGELGGEPSTIGAYTFDVQVTDAQQAAQTAAIALDVIDPAASLTITTADIPSAMVSEAYDASFMASGGTEPYTWRIDGVVPGLSFEPSTQHLTGTPTVAGSYPLVVEVRDGRGLLDRNAYVLRVFELGELSILTGRTADTKLPAGKVGVPYADASGQPVLLRAVKKGGGQVVGLDWLVALGTLPTGLFLDSATGAISGTPTEVGTFAFTVLAHDGSGDRDRATQAIVITDNTTTPGMEETGCSCSNSSARGSADAAIWFALLLVGLGRRRARTLLFFGVLLVPAAAFAQPIPYLVSSEVAPFQPLTNATRIMPALGDGETRRIALPFELTFYGQNYRAIYVNPNGIAAFTDIGFGNNFPASAMPSGGAPNGFIAPLWGDWCASPDFSCGGVLGQPGTGVYYQIDATPGAGAITIEWRSLRSFSDFVMASDVSFQLTLHEGPASQTEVHFGTITPGTSFDSLPSDFLTRTGLESADGRYGMWFGPCAGASLCDTSMVVGLSGQRFRLIADAGEDVAIAALSAPAVGYPGLSFDVQARYLNRHQTPLGPTQVELLLIPGTETSTRGGIVLYTSAPITLNGFESRALELSVSLPANLVPGRYRVALVGDALGALAETNETNNVALSAPVRVVERAPDLAVVSVHPVQSSVTPGGPLAVEWRVENRGNLRGQARLGLYLSTNAAITPSDESLVAPIDVALDPGQSENGTANLSLADPHATGLFHLGGIIDFAGALTELDETNNVGLSPSTVTVSTTEVMILTSELPVATLTQSYRATLTTVGGQAPVVLSIGSGALPRGLGFDANHGELFGIPVEVGTFPLVFHAASGNGHSVDRSLELIVLDPSVPLTVVTHQLEAAVVGSDYAAQIQVVGGQPPLRYRLRGSLPEGLSLGTDGVIFGVPSRPGPSQFVVEVLDEQTTTASAALSLDVRAPANLTIPSQVLERAVVDTQYRATFLALGGVGQLRWTGGADVPRGLVVTEVGELTGTPEQVGTFDFEISVQDSVGKIDTNRVTLVIDPRLRLRIATTELPAPLVGQPYRVQVRVEGGKRPYQWTVAEAEGRLPPGLTASPGDPALPNESSNDLAIAGTVSEVGVWAFTVRVKDGQGQVVDRAFALVSKTPEPETPADAGGCQAVHGGPGALSSVVLGLGWWALGRRRKRRLF